MENIKFEKFSDMECFFNDDNVKFVGKGTEGACYKIGTKTYKIYKEDYFSMCDEVETNSELLKFKDLMIDNVYFIRALIYCEGKIVGSVCDYASGITCDKLNLWRRNLDSLILALSILKKNIYELSQLGICVEDTHLCNFLYDGTSFKLIDTGGYYYLNDDCYVYSEQDILNIYKKNMSKVMCLLFEGITNITEFNRGFIFSYLSDTNSLYKEYLFDSYLLMNPDETIRGIRNQIQDDIGREIFNFGNCRKELSRLRKK